MPYARFFFSSYYMAKTFATGGGKLKTRCLRWCEFQSALFTLWRSSAYMYGDAEAYRMVAAVYMIRRRWYIGKFSRLACRLLLRTLEMEDLALPIQGFQCLILEIKFKEWKLIIQCRRSADVPPAQNLRPPESSREADTQDETKWCTDIRRCRYIFCSHFKTSPLNEMMSFYLMIWSNQLYSRLNGAGCAMYNYKARTHSAFNVFDSTKNNCPTETPRKTYVIFGK